MARRPRDDEDDDFDDDDDDREADPPFPGTVRAAGVIWLVLSGLCLLGSCLSYFVFPILLRLGNGDDRPGKFAPSSGEVCSFGLGIGLAVAFFVFGLLTVRGSVRDTLAGSILSLVVGVFYVVVGAVGFVLGMSGPNALVIGGVMATVLGFCCLLPGGLGLMGRPGYLRWRKATDPRRRRREEYDDEDEDYDRKQPARRRQTRRDEGPTTPVDCPRCFRTLKVPVKYAGQTYTCPHCQNPLDVPAQSD
jgi:hypothetical protein